MSARTLSDAFRLNFLGHSPVWYKMTIIGFLILNPILYAAAGPFIARAVRCGEHVIYFDAWLYSPNPRRSKYEYMMQLEEILNSFTCVL